MSRSGKTCLIFHSSVPLKANELDWCLCFACCDGVTASLNWVTLCFQSDGWDCCWWARTQNWIRCLCIRVLGWGSSSLKTIQGCLIFTHRENARIMSAVNWLNMLKLIRPELTCSTLSSTNYLGLFACRPQKWAVCLLPVSVLCFVCSTCKS